MGSYYEHKQTLRTEIPYSFRCESCGRDSGPMRAIVQVDSKLSSHRKELNDKEKEKLSERTEKLLSDEVKEIYEDVHEKNVYPDNFVDKCPHCGAPQSWAVSGLKKKMYSTPSLILLLGLFIGGFMYVGRYLDEDIANIPPALCLGIIAAAAVAALVSLLINMSKIKSKVKTTSNAMSANLPQIQWEAVQNIMNRPQ